ncbi:mycothiol maleylpyruvate isomerase N-terminal domain [Longilinea arvoryzae]|uniref:Mycothiol maleylpyruvate isomerase N-terminal domain n=1 Tax=Longilinea arvoryzae TaxID=360412 RepID=A0A0S7BIS7_9CHLR|nr:DinB family protein [Longilinea arvoryzae]GAP14082.1 mycothiol maleylpyruvate isomerase N-terminal domain [Longilinea arvoryzae]
MNKAELLKRLAENRDQLNVLLEGVPEEELIKPGAYGEWSVKDVLEHISRWESELIKVLYQAAQGAEPESEVFNPEYLKVNDVWFQESKDRPLERVMDDFQSARKQLIRRMTDFPEKQLTTPGVYPWMKKHALIVLLKDIALEHEEEHLEGLKTWRAALKS